MWVIPSPRTKKVTNQRSLAFFNTLFLVPKPNNKWRPILDLSSLNKCLKSKKFKIETPLQTQQQVETYPRSELTEQISEIREIRNGDSREHKDFLAEGEWVTSIDFKGAYFHIPINPQSRKYLQFHVQGQSYQFKAQPFGLSTSLMEFTVIVKEVNLMAQNKGIRIHQY